MHAVAQHDVEYVVLADTGSHALVAAASVIVLHGALAAQQIGRRDELAGLELRRATAQLCVVRDVHDDFVELVVRVLFCVERGEF